MRLPLDVHLPPGLAEDLRTRGTDAVSAVTHRGGTLREVDDALLLAAATEEGRVLGTYDVATIPDLLVQWATAGRHHAGVLLIHRVTIPQGDRGLLLRALVALASQWPASDWTDRCQFLRRPR